MKKSRTANIEGVAELVDQYGKIDCDMKNLNLRLAALKITIVDAARKFRQDAEISLRLKGAKYCSVLVIFSQKRTLDTSSENFSVIQEAVEKGELAGVVEKTVSATVRPEKLEELSQLIGNRLNEFVEVGTVYQLNDKNYAKLGEPGETDSTRMALESCVVKDEVVRLKPEIEKV